MHNKFKLHFSNISFLILSFLKKLMNNAFEYHRENRMSSEFYHTIHIHSDCIEFEQNLWPLLFPLRSKSYSWCMNVRAIMQFLSFWQWSDILAEKWKGNARSAMSCNPFESSILIFILMHFQNIFTYETSWKRGASVCYLVQDLRRSFFYLSGPLQSIRNSQHLLENCHFLYAV